MLDVDLEIGYLSSQDEVFFQSQAQFRVITKGRRAGFTRGGAQYAIECLLDGEPVLWVDTVQINLDAYFQIYMLPVLKQIPREYWTYNQSRHDLDICGTKLNMRSAERPENIEGFAYPHIILNESGIILKGQRGRNLWQSSIFPMIMDYNSNVYFIGTPKGKKAGRGEISETGRCLYYEHAERGNDDSKPKWETFNYSSYTNPVLDKEAIKEIEAEVPLALRRQEIYGEFIDLGGQLIFKAEWFHIVDNSPVEYRRKIMSLDTAFKKEAHNDFSAGVVFLETNNDYYWLDTFNLKLEFPQLIEKTISWYNYHKPDVVLIEDKASGQSLIQALRQETRIPIHLIKVDTDRLSRTNAITPYFSTGLIKLVRGGWNRESIDQLCEYNGIEDDLNDDIVDTVTQLLNYSKRSRIDYKPVSIPRTNITRRHKILTGF
jgi:predicted phage terminase large subunit-like protein